MQGNIAASGGRVRRGLDLKLPGGTDNLEELELRLTLGRPARRPPAELVALTRVYARGAIGPGWRGSHPPAPLGTRRRRRAASLPDDHLTAKTMGEQTTTGSWREVEVELGEHGQHKLLDRIDRRLLKVGAQRAGFSSKLGRLLADRILPRAAPPHFARSAGRLYWLT